MEVSFEPAKYNQSKQSCLGRHTSVPSRAPKLKLSSVSRSFRDEPHLGEIVEGLRTLPLLFMAEEDAYERSCRFSSLLLNIRGPIVSKLELEPVVDDKFREPSFL